MAQYTEVATGTLGINWLKTSPKHPDFRGSMTMDGQTYTISAWSRTRSEDGRPFYSFNLSKLVEGPGPSKPEPPVSVDDDKDTPAF